MLNVIFTLDYEIHGNGEGCPYELMVEPTERLMALFDQYGAKLTIMAEVAEILKFREYRERNGRDCYVYGAIRDQLCRAIQRGHDVQLHLHPSYFNAIFDGRWNQDWTEYNFACLPFERADEIVRTGKTYLEELLRTVDEKYECVAFRAANWSMSPSRNAVRALIKNGIKIDTSVFKYGRRDGLVKFDYSHAPSELVPWTVDENDICKVDPSGALTEWPIYCERRWVGAFLTPNRIERVLMTRTHALADAAMNATRQQRSAWGIARYIKRFIMQLLSRHARKADFNQCTGGQLVRALRRAHQKHFAATTPLPFVLIGHSKSFSRANERSLRPFLKEVVDHPEIYRFSTFLTSHEQYPDEDGIESSFGALCYEEDTGLGPRDRGSCFRLHQEQKCCGI